MTDHVCTCSCSRACMCVWVAWVECMYLKGKVFSGGCWHFIHSFEYFKQVCQRRTLAKNFVHTPQITHTHVHTLTHTHSRTHTHTRKHKHTVERQPSLAGCQHATCRICSVTQRYQLHVSPSLGLNPHRPCGEAKLRCALHWEVINPSKGEGSHLLPTFS